MAQARNASAAKRKPTGNGANLGFEQKLWAAADKLRGHMDAAEYKHVVLGLIFLKYISDAFQERYEALKTDKLADPEDRDEYTAENVFWVPKEARWGHIQGKAKQTTIGKIIDDAMVAIEKENPSLKGVLPKDYARPGLDKQRLGQLINLVSDIGLGAHGRLRGGVYSRNAVRQPGRAAADDQRVALSFLISVTSSGIAFSHSITRP